MTADKRIIQQQQQEQQQQQQIPWGQQLVVIMMAYHLAREVPGIASSYDCSIDVFSTVLLLLLSWLCHLAPTEPGR
jgi:hypothetical protein